jgi:hypothetical protein
MPRQRRHRRGDLRRISRQRGEHPQERLRQPKPCTHPLQPGHQYPARAKAQQRARHEDNCQQGVRHSRRPAPRSRHPARRSSVSVGPKLASGHDRLVSNGSAGPGFLALAHRSYPATGTSHAALRGSASTCARRRRAGLCRSSRRSVVHQIVDTPQLSTQRIRLVAVQRRGPVADQTLGQRDATNGRALCPQTPTDRAEILSD